MWLSLPTFISSLCLCVSVVQMTCAIVLAAGKSQRMGTQKLLLPYAGHTMIARVTDAFLFAPVDLVYVVVPPGTLTIRTALAGRAVTFVENPDPAGDMLSSVRCGIRALPAQTDIILVSPGDQPALKSTLVRDMLEAFRRTGSKILVPIHNGRRGHPLAFRSEFRQQILTRFDGTGLRSLLLAHAPDVTEWETTDSAVLQDLDTPADLQSFKLIPP